MEEVGRQKNGSGFAGAQDPTWFRILNRVLSDTNEGIDGVCSNLADTSLNDFFGKKKRIRKLTKVP